MGSLDVDSPEIMPFIPYLLKDLWELGSIPEYVIELVDRHIPTESLRDVIDLGCGKGAVLIKLYNDLGISGTGYDLVEEFILEAKEKAIAWECEDQVRFEQRDMREVVEQGQAYDLVIYGHDSEVFGDVRQSLEALKQITTKGSWIILETVYLAESDHSVMDPPTEADLKRQLAESGLEVVDQIEWELKAIQEANAKNNRHIQRRVEDLSTAFPEKAQLFADYLTNQFKEAQELEEQLVCVTVLLRKGEELKQAPELDLREKEAITDDANWE